MNAPLGQDYFLRVAGAKNPDASQTIHLLRARYKDRNDCRKSLHIYG